MSERRISSGYFAPQLMGLLRDLTGNYRLGLLVVGGIVLFAAVLLPLYGVRMTEPRAAQVPSH